MKKVLGKIGWIVVTVLPAILFFFVQIVVVAAAMAYFSVDLLLNNPEMRYLDNKTFMDYVLMFYSQNVMAVMIISQVLALIALGLWYYILRGRHTGRTTGRTPSLLQLLYIFLLGISSQIIISGALSIIEMLIPHSLDEYALMMEEAGLNEVTIPVVISTVILAPICEEITCRGLVLHLAHHVTEKFWVANCIQALCFGILHGNIVQGIYAFLLGIVLGYLYKCFHNIWLCMLLHASMNLSGVLLDTFINLFPEEYQGAIFMVALLAASISFAPLFKGLKNKKNGV